MEITSNQFLFSEMFCHNIFQNRGPIELWGWTVTADAWGAWVEHTQTPNPIKQRVQTSRSLQLLIPKGKQAFPSQLKHELQYTAEFSTLKGSVPPCISYKTILSFAQTVWNKSNLNFHRELWAQKNLRNWTFWLLPCLMTIVLLWPAGNMVNYKTLNLQALTKGKAWQADKTRHCNEVFLQVLLDSPHQKLELGGRAGEECKVVENSVPHLDNSWVILQPVFYSQTRF